MRATFLLPKDPGHQAGGDSTMATLLIGLARASYQTSVICLSPQPERHGDGIRRVVKAPPRAGSLLYQSLRRGRSLVHSRFAPDQLVAAVDAADTDIFVAIHSYMAEAVVRSRRYRTAADATSMLAISTEVPEAPVWRASRGVVGRIDSRRITRDEIRMARRAYSVGTYDLDETRFYAGLIHRAHWLDVTLPPVTPVDIAASGPRLVFLGNRTYGPNQQAYRALLRCWPRIADGITGANLCIVGPAPASTDAPPLPDGVRVLGFVEQLDQFLGTCRALVAPIRTGGGVRVKVLDAARRGLPVVGTPEGIGSLATVFGLEAYDDDSAVIEQSRRYLLDAAAAATDGGVLYEKNAARWHEGKPHAAVQDWLAS